MGVGSRHGSQSRHLHPPVQGLPQVMRGPCPELCGGACPEQVDYRFAPTCAGSRCSVFPNSAVDSGAQFPPSNIWRISFSPSPATSMKRRLHSIASSFDLTSKSAKPAISSLVSVKGPSVTVNFPPEYRTRAPFELGMHPSVASSTPALVISSMSFPMLAIVSWLGGVPSGAAGRYSPKNFMLVLLVDRLGFRAGATSC